MDSKYFNSTSQELTEISKSTQEAEPIKLLLDFNSLTVLPPYVYNEYVHVSSLSLNSNKIETLPLEISNLTLLKELFLNKNSLVELPHNIDKLKCLEKLHITDNQLTTFPESFGCLKNLKELIANENKIKSLPTEIGELSELSHLELNNNSISYLPESFGKLLSLKGFYISFNSLLTLPSSFQNLCSLEVMDLSNNRIISLPENFSSTHSLKKIFISHNRLKCLPRWFSDLTNVTDITLANNILQENPFTEEFGTVCKYLKLLDLRGNNINALPSSFGNLISLEVLLLGASDKPKLNGLLNACNCIPRLTDSFPLLSSLTKLDLNNNDLTELPNDFGILSSISYLDLSRNMISMLPDSFCDLQSMEECFLSTNYLSCLPENFGSLSSLKTLKLEENKLHELPESFGRLNNLVHLTLSCNKIKEIPVCLKLLKSLKELDLTDINENGQTDYECAGNIEQNDSSPDIKDWQGNDIDSYLTNGCCESISNISFNEESDTDTAHSPYNSDRDHDTEDQELWDNDLLQVPRASKEDLTSSISEASSVKDFDNFSDSSDWENDVNENPRNFERIYAHPIKSEETVFIPSDIHADLISRTEVWSFIEEGQFDDADDL